jgi:hypothetical protein
MGGSESFQGFRFVPLFDDVERDQPRPWRSRPWIDDPAERDRILGYLRAGAPVERRDLWMTDLLDPGRGRVVPFSFFTDGTWIWSDASAYHLQAHGLAPEPEFLAAVEANGYRCPAVPEERRLAAREAYRARAARRAEQGAEARHREALDADRERTPFTLVRGELSNQPPTVPMDPELFDDMIEGRHHRFPEEVENTLVAAGWLPGRDASARVDPWLDVFCARSVGGRHHDAFPAARRILHEFGLLDIDQFGFGEQEPLQPVHLFPMDVWIDPWDYARLARSLGKQLFPIGQVGESGDYLLADFDGRVFRIGELGVHFLGDTIDAALEVLIRGLTPAEVVDGRWKQGSRA